jgi:PBP1b-binding outer membrane lipoprotein LpoB
LKNLLKILILTLILTSCKNEVEKKTEFKAPENQPKKSTEIIENNRAEKQM